MPASQADRDDAASPRLSISVDPHRVEQVERRHSYSDSASVISETASSSTLSVSGDTEAVEAAELQPEAEAGSLQPSIEAASGNVRLDHQSRPAQSAHRPLSLLDASPDQQDLNSPGTNVQTSVLSAHNGPSSNNNRASTTSALPDQELAARTPADPSSDTQRQSVHSARALFALWSLGSGRRTRGEANRTTRRSRPYEASRYIDSYPLQSQSDRALAHEEAGNTSEPRLTQGSRGSISGRRREGSMDLNNYTNRARPSSHDYAGWAPGTTASDQHQQQHRQGHANQLDREQERAYRPPQQQGQHPRQTATDLAAMATRTAASSPNADSPQAPLVLTAPSSSSSSSSSSGISSAGNSSLERRYIMERQRHFERLRHERAGQSRTQTRSDAPYSTAAAGPGGGFASTVVDSDGNPIDTGSIPELLHPRSIVYNPPPSYRTPPMLDSQELHSRGSNPHDDFEDLERYLATSHDTSSATWNDALARYTNLQRQERLERVQRHQRNLIRSERLRRTGAATGDANPVNGRFNHLDELRRNHYRNLHELHRDRHPAVPPITGSPNAVRDGIKRSIQYLHRIRVGGDACTTRSERLEAAREEGFGREANGPDAFDRSDFIVDTSVLGPMPETSWLTPGTVFNGSQRATSICAVPPYNMVMQRDRVAAVRALLAEPSGEESPSSDGAPSGSRDWNMASFGLDYSLLRSMLRRDRHSGARPESNWHSPTSARPEPSSPIQTRDSAANTGSRSSTALNSNEINGCDRDAKLADSEDTWPVKVTVTSVDYDNMTLTGTMEAMDVPRKDGPSTSSSLAEPLLSRSAPTVRDAASDGNTNGDDGTAMAEAAADSGGSGADRTITTFLEGEIIDLQHFSLETRGYKADSSVDSTYWRRLEPFRSLQDKEAVQNMLSTRWLTEKIGREYVLMRWKEKCFVDPSDEKSGGLTISGFYYISLHRGSGRTEGLYYDPKSSPYQHLRLTPKVNRHFPTYQFQ